MVINLGFNTILFLIFLTLKLTGVLTWSWILVTAPLWLPFAIFASVIAGTFIVGMILALLSGK